MTWLRRIFLPIRVNTLIAKCAMNVEMWNMLRTLPVKAIWRTSHRGCIIYDDRTVYFPTRRCCMIQCRVYFKLECQNHQRESLIMTTGDCKTCWPRPRRLRIATAACIETKHLSGFYRDDINAENLRAPLAQHCAKIDFVSPTPPPASLPRTWDETTRKQLTLKNKLKITF